MKTNTNTGETCMTLTSKAIRTLGSAAMLALMSQGAAAEGKLNLYKWGDYINPELIDAFSKEFGV